MVAKASLICVLFTVVALATPGFATLRMWLVLLNWGTGLPRWELKEELHMMICLALVTTTSITSLLSAEGVWGGLLWKRLFQWAGYEDDDDGGNADDGGGAWRLALENDMPYIALK